MDLTCGAYRLRPLAANDATALHAYVNDWSVVRMLSSLPFPYPLEAAEAWIAHTREARAAGTAWHFAICRADDPAETLLGCVGITLAPDRRAELGYWIGRPHWRQGIAGACAARARDWALAHLDIDTLCAAAAEDNPASLRVLERLGMRRVGTGTRRFLARGEDQHPVALFEIGRESEAPREQHTGGSSLLLVAAAALVDLDTRVLLARRPEGKPLAGLWEFPGGKIEAGETPERALVRELREELGLTVAPDQLAPFAFASHDLGGRHLLMPLFVCRRWQGTPTPREGQALAWVRARDLREYRMPEADLPLIPLLQDLL